MTKVFIILFIAVIFGSQTFSQNVPMQDSLAQYGYTFPQFCSETGNFLIQPASWDGNDWLTLGLIGGGTILMMQTIDQPIRDAVLRDQKYYYSAPIEFGRMWGELYSPVILFSGFAIHSLVMNDKDTREIAYEIGQASLYAGALTFILKMVIGRKRPFVNEGSTAFHPISTVFDGEFQSLPGGHNAAAMVLSTLLSRNAKPVWLKVVAYVPAALTFVSRSIKINTGHLMIS